MKFLKKFRLLNWTIKAFWGKHKRLLLTSTLIGIGGFFIATRIFPYLPDFKEHKRIAKVGIYEPHNLPSEIERFLSVGLTKVSEDGQATPGLAKSWEISDEGKTYIFHLADDIFWLDGTPIIAEEIEYNFSNVEQEVIDEKTIRFRLEEPFAPFLTTVGEPIFRKDGLGIGPYRIKRIQKKGEYIEKIILAGVEDDITFRFYPNEAASLIGFKLGEVDIIEQNINFKLDDSWKKYVQVDERIDKNKYLGIFLNTENPLLSDKAVRQALAYAIKEKPTGDGRALGPISPQSWAYNNQLKRYEFDPEKAKELLKSEDNDTIEMKIKISVTEDFLEAAEQVKKSWEKILDLETEIQLINVLPAEFQVVIGIQEIPSDPDQYIFWHSTRQENITRLRNPRIDKLLEDGRKTIDLEVRKEKYLDFQKSLAEEAPVIFLAHPAVYRVSRKPLFTFF